MLIIILLLTLAYFVLPQDYFIKLSLVVFAIILFPSVLKLVLAILEIFILYFIVISIINFIEDKKDKY